MGTRSTDDPWLRSSRPANVTNRLRLEPNPLPARRAPSFCAGLALCAVALCGCGLAIGKRQFVVQQGSSGNISAYGNGGQVPQTVSELPLFHRGKPPHGKPTEAEEAQRFKEALAYVDRHCPCTFEHTNNGLRVVSIARP
jgi:hypothetical protein